MLCLAFELRAVGCQAQSRRNSIFRVLVRLCYSKNHNLEKIEFVRAENTHLLCKRKYHCTHDLLFDWLGFNCFACVELYRDLQVWSKSNQSNRRSTVQQLDVQLFSGQRVIALACLFVRSIHLQASFLLNKLIF